MSELQGNISPAAELQGSINHLKILLLSAYGIAVKNGFEGTEAEWLESLKGAPGEPGSPGVKGDPGEPGERGAVYVPTVTQTRPDQMVISYDLMDSATSLSMAQTIDLLPGAKGDPGENATDEQVTSAVNAYLAKNPPKDGKDGVDGQPGKDGVGIKSVAQTTTSSADGGSNVVTVTKTDGTTSTFTVKNGSKGSKGDKGDPGEPGSPGSKGDPGEPGATGRRGNGILKVTTAPTAETSTVDGYSYKYKFLLSNVLSESGASEVLTGDVIKYSYYEYSIGYVGASYAFAYTRTSIRGATGAQGDKGDPGLQGPQGTPGDPGYTPVRGTDYWTPDDVTAMESDISEKVASAVAGKTQLKPEFANSIDECTDTSKLYVLPDGMIYAYMLTEVEVKLPYTNVLPLAINSNGEPYIGDNGEKGYRVGYRVNSSGAEVASTAHTATGFIPAKTGDVIRTTGFTPAAQGSNCLQHYTASFAKVGTQLFPSDYSEFTVGGTDASVYIRICVGTIASDAVVTVNEEITGTGGGTITEYAWTNTGHAFVPADYEDRIISVEETTAAHTTKIAALEKAVETGGTDETEAAALEKIKTWDKPVYDSSPVTLLGDDRTKPALTKADMTVAAIHAKYRALMTAHPRYIKETNLGPCTASDVFPAVDMLRFDLCEPAGLTEPSLGPEATHETKPKIIFISGIHKEWAGVYGLYYALEEITTNPAFYDIRRNAHIIVVPCANPFGLTDQTAIEGWQMSHVNANGIAPHNNFGVNHRSLGTVGEYNYGGTIPYSELENQYIDAVMAENSDAIAFVTCHNNNYSTYYGSHVIWASSATYHMCNLTFRLVDKMTTAWLDKYGQTLKDAIDQYKFNMDADDYRLGRATMSTSRGTEQANATKYGILATNLEIPDRMRVFSGETTNTSDVMTRGAEVYANFIRIILSTYDANDRKTYAPNLPWSE